MKTVNTVIVNIIRIIRFSNEKNEKVIYQYWKVGQELCSANKVYKFGSDFMNVISIGLKRKGVENKAYNKFLLSPLRLVEKVAENFSYLFNYYPNF